MVERIMRNCFLRKDRHTKEYKKKQKEASKLLQEFMKSNINPDLWTKIVKELVWEQ